MIDIVMTRVKSQRHTFESLARGARLHKAEVLGLLPKH